MDPETGESRVEINGKFELLGAAIGDKTFCENYCADKVGVASKLLKELSSLEDPQAALRLMRNCAGACKVTHSMRMTPSHLQCQAMAKFDSEVRLAFNSVTGLMPDSEQWAQACRGTKQAGFGLRSAALHSTPAFLASSCAARDLCHRLDPNFALGASDPSSDFGLALAAFNNKLPGDKQLTPGEVPSHRQRHLSQLLDKAGHEARLAGACVVDQATINSECEDGARDLFELVPSRALGLAVPATEFVNEVRFRL